MQIPQSYYDSTRSRESSGNPNATNPRSTATGLYQFTQPTWQTLMKNHPDLGLTPDGRTNPQQSEAAMRRFTENNADVLTKSGISINDKSLYAAHRFGVEGAKRAFAADPASSVASVFPEVMSANPDLQGKTIGDITGSGAPPMAQALTQTGGPKVASSGPFTSVYPRGPVGTATPADDEGSLASKFIAGGPGALFGAPNGVFQKADGTPGYDAGSALTGAGAALASIGSPSQAAALASMRGTGDNYATSIDQTNGQIVRVDKRSGAVTTAPLPGFDPNREQTQAYKKSQGETYAKMNAEIPTAADAADSHIASLQQAKQFLLNPSVYQGGGGSYVQEAKKLGNALGMNFEGVAEGDVVKSLAAQLTLQGRTANGGMPGSLSDKDLAFLKSMNISLDNQPEANAKILDNLMSIHKRTKEVEGLRQQYLATHPQLDDGFRKTVTDHANAHPLFNTDDTMPAQRPASKVERKPLGDIFKTK